MRPSNRKVICHLSSGNKHEKNVYTTIIEPIFRNANIYIDNSGFGSKFHQISHEEGRSIQRQKRCECNNKYVGNSPNSVNSLFYISICFLNEQCSGHIAVGAKNLTSLLLNVKHMKNNVMLFLNVSFFLQFLKHHFVKFCRYQNKIGR